MIAADHPRTYHRRIAEPKPDGDAPTLCGRTVNYQQTMKSIDDVDCPACTHAADTIVDEFVRDWQATIDLALAKPGRPASS